MSATLPEVGAGCPWGMAHVGEGCGRCGAMPGECSLVLPKFRGVFLGNWGVCSKRRPVLENNNLVFENRRASQGAGMGKGVVIFWRSGDPLPLWGAYFFLAVKPAIPAFWVHVWNFLLSRVVFLPDSISPTTGRRREDVCLARASLIWRNLAETIPL